MFEYMTRKLVHVFEEEDSSMISLFFDVPMSYKKKSKLAKYKKRLTMSRL
jgi:hypothetical protein